jgi:hypothetical protein
MVLLPIPLASQGEGGAKRGLVSIRRAVALLQPDAADLDHSGRDQIGEAPFGKLSCVMAPCRTEVMISMSACECGGKPVFRGDLVVIPDP